MKKTMAMIVALTLAFAACGALAEEARMQERLERYYGQPVYGVAPLAEFGEEQQALYPVEVEQPERLILVQNPILPAIWLRIPDDAADADEYRFKALRFVLEEESMNPDVPLNVLEAFGGGIMETPVSLEIAGELAYGFIDALSDETLMVKLISYCELGNPGDMVQLAIDADTVGYYWDEAHPVVSVGELSDYFVPGQSCDILYDPETKVILTMWHANG